MTIYKNKVKSEFVQIRNSLLSDPSLSWKAKGILSYLISKPTTWNASPLDIERRATDGSCSVSSGLNELEIAGYIVRGQERDKSGKFVSFVFDVHDMPVPEEERTTPDDRSRKTDTGKPHSGKQPYSNTEESNKETHEEFEELFGKDKPRSEEKIDWADKDVRNARLIAATGKFMGKADDEPWLTWNTSKISPRDGIDKEHLQHIGWLMESITGIVPKSDGTWANWRKAYVDMYKEADGDFDIIEKAIRLKWPMDSTKYRTSSSAKYIEAIQLIAAGEVKPPENATGSSSRKIWEM